MKKPLQASAKKTSARKSAATPRAAQPVKAVPATPATKAPKATKATKANQNEGAAPVAASRPSGRRLQVRKSGVHGKGVYALQPFKRGDLVMEYVGEVITWPEALRRHPHDPSDPNHTFYFHVDENRVIDGNVGGNSARWINHSCRPNCKAYQTEEGRVFIRVWNNLKPGDELFYDYGLFIDERYTPKLKKEYECRCGHSNCRGTMLAPKR